MSLTPETVILIEKLVNRLDELTIMQPLDYELGELSRLCGKSGDTIRKYLHSNYVDDRDYHQKTKRGKIYVARAAALEIRRHYVK